MKKTAILSALSALGLALAACSSAPTPAAQPSATPAPDQPAAPTPTPLPSAAPSYDPQPLDKKWTVSKVYIEGAEILTLETDPPQYMLHVAGNLPNPCHNLRIKVNPPDAKNNLLVEVYAVVDPTKNCIEVIKPFDASVRLDVGLAKGQYTVFVNGSQIGQFELQ